MMKVGVVGMGLAGGLLAVELIDRGCDVTVFHNPALKSSSRVAAGLFNAIIPRRVTRTWNSESLFPVLHSFYPALENKLGSHFFHPKDILHLFEYSKEQNDWLSKAGTDKFKDYFTSGQIEFIEDPNLKAPMGAIRIAKGGYCDTNVLLDSLEEYLGETSTVIEGSFDHDQLIPSGDKWIYNEEEYDAIIFCEGIHATKHDLFERVEFKPVKGELLKVKCSELQLKEILLGHGFIIPLDNDEYYVGSTYDWDYKDDLPTEEGLEQLIAKWERYINSKFELIEHRSGIRPAVKDRRPLLGEHPERSGLYMFNGFGSKAVSMVPFFSKIFCDYLIDKKPLISEISISRY